MAVNGKKILLASRRTNQTDIVIRLLEKIDMLAAVGIPDVDVPRIPPRVTPSIGVRGSAMNVFLSRRGQPGFGALGDIIGFQRSSI